MGDFNDDQQNVFRGFAKQTDYDPEEEKRRKAGIAALSQKIKDVFSGPSASERFTRSIQSYKDKNNQE